MIADLVGIFKFFIEHGIFFYSLFLFISYIILSIVSALEMASYMRKNSFVDYNVILSSPLAPSLSIIAPAYNEGKTIVENIKSLMSVHYPDFDVIIVNDGSKDDTLEKVVCEYELELVNYAVNYIIPCEPIRGIYKSKNKAFYRLTVIDKANSGKADSLNAALNISTKKYFAAIDVDSIIEQDALLKMIKPFLEQTDKKVIASGGVIRIANDCKVEGGKIVEVNFPKSFLPRFQVLEYTRSFLMGRMAWSKLNGLLLISGAFGIFDREIVIAVGGYDASTVGEDMELVVRMRGYMEERKEKYQVVYIPDPLCWTEVPSKLKVLGRQRNRWARGTIDTLFIHKKLFFNKNYGLLGLLSHPYWFFFEWLAPIIETIGFLYFLLVIAIGKPDWVFFSILFSFIYLFAVSFTIWSFLFEELSFHRYKKRGDIFRVMLTALIEPILYHPLNVWFALRGNYHYLIGKTAWGKMERTGFAKQIQKKSL